MWIIKYHNKLYYRRNGGNTNKLSEAHRFDTLETAKKMSIILNSLSTYSGSNKVYRLVPSKKAKAKHRVIEAARALVETHDLILGDKIEILNSALKLLDKEMLAKNEKI